MQEKQKVTLYLPPELHRRLKIQAAVDSQAMSAIVERAILLYLEHPEILEQVENAHGQTYQVHACPECSSSVVIRDGELISLKGQPSVLADEELPVKRVQSDSTSHQGEEELVPC
ncbi:hypothetical protein H6G20_05120 [Desertifilum sp. FACHB-1129]|uniref:CopG family transcriptional regulator n=2 Tax=Desertifilum tharense IPPAS B-1220 TaxID=1781255 RepID=A0A1E5QN52_9CYAN|nr:MULTISPECIES: hypothetical protein [Desertifilum]MCD8485409.1 hypothetical protein [Desertifilum sp.]MDA0208866.1 hypothetical protein [Cyanobacteria bacterium FC1]NES95500.1 hypothetical protein [Desertifilum sp. SIO1I2]MBD2311067.1 hypothetical protein [Desertifilum sp. FACHB-1129]MBD2321472.1 hypothetical protein [Desertifilum sp. FACHB-866]